jgi:hypothetical protein
MKKADTGRSWDLNQAHSFAEISSIRTLSKQTGNSKSMIETMHSKLTAQVA